jgi:hypothetical protein
MEQVVVLGREAVRNVHKELLQMQLHTVVPSIAESSDTLCMLSCVALRTCRTSAGKCVSLHKSQLRMVNG